MDIRGIIFDKDGTLFDYKTTWNAWSMGLIHDFAQGDLEKTQRLADALFFDLESQSFLPTSPVIAGTNQEVAELLAPEMPQYTVPELEDILMHASFKAPQSQVVPLFAFFQTLKIQGIKLGVVTNDTEQGAISHLTQANALDPLDFVIGFNSGFGAKPDPDPLLAFAQKMQIAPEQVAMVGDSLHDLIAGQRAGMYCIGVLTGMATHDDLVDHANVVLNNIGEIPNHFGFSS